MDTYIAFLCDKLGELSSGVPDALRIYKHGRSRLLAGDLVASKKAEVLNYILHSSVIPSEARLSDGVIFGYGGIGIVLHHSVMVGAGTVIGANVTLGGGGARGTYWIDEDQKKNYAPKIHDCVYLSTGAKVLGGIEVGRLSIIGANSVVRANVPPLSVIAGAPGRVVNRITVENCLRYKSTFYSLRDIPDPEFIEMVAQCQ
jgi:serine O-acetyltransferase